MKKLTGNQVRQMYLDFFVSKGHCIEPSASLVPVDDPSLLWINSGVATLKKYFDGRIIPDNPRITNAQKSIRTNDIENVGRTARHHTFFEMLGNFSIGDYFKVESIHWAWEFLTSPEWIGFDPEKLSVTIHPEDDEAFEIWNKEIGVPEERIIRLEGNFWDIGEGPSGPNTEIFYDRGESFGNDPSDPELYPGGENERYLEVWNLVFSQFNHNPDGTYTPLPKKNIDTGMGLERMVSVIQNVDNNYETDLLFPLIEQTSKISGVSYKTNDELDVALKVIADHVRTVTFAIGDGALPSNEGRGYVLRRLLRRAVRMGKMLGIQKPFLYTLTKTVGDMMGVFYPEVVQKRDFIERVIRAEEERFHETLEEGLSILEGMVKATKASGGNQLSGPDTFKLYDTYGFPIDLTEDFAMEHGLSVDRDGFEQAMEEQRERARAARQDVDSMQTQGGALSELTVASEFIGYTTLFADAKVEAIIVNNQLVKEAQEGVTCQVVLDRTPFYAESGGQINDEGTLTADTVKARVLDVQKGPHGQNVHQVLIEAGTLHVGAQVAAEVDQQGRNATIKNHTATHLLHQALKDVLGTHVNQAGSLVSPERLRFDFTHISSITAEELERIEQIVNEQIWNNLPVNITNMKIAEAKEMGAMALFGEKYGDVVRVVNVEGYSIELCGGCHVGNTAEIGLFKILSESGIGAGTRRIEAVTGRGAYQYLNQQLTTLKEVAQAVKSPQLHETPTRVEGVLAQLKETQREAESLRTKLGNIEAGTLTDQVQEINGVKLLATQVSATDMDNLRGMVDELKNKLGSAIIVLGSVEGDKVNIVAGVTKDLMGQGFHAGKIVKEVATRCGGGGGGRPDMAQAGGKEPAKLGEALSIVASVVEGQAVANQ
ncbi:alanine--tRNA ligase [Brevibacillus laterosporus]|uniref:alanine--tRNA ligase n=1 Tax=Brevibacillus laterosporus TaxID=1465 RepID=UPI00037A060F|nr:alanine--tRNA ligase [Brevibacillus laterosporus]ATO50618.1 alanine--tRNA ligase [Brevibacillus laterosporus DSM 25]MBG9801969.1 alanine--tRNA ligase [Brevibacillus laterosporus]MED2002274.1 alanine--tRNA ligase [Brevibacillus laterosporus]MED4763787.1 alanine--tRNA ligase [Brevibacillus laterosporus]TPH10186.1 alanine--tRNA ligase [Brevibacillus laterosporus]